jgi:hypothetical protein
MERSAAVQRPVLRDTNRRVSAASESVGGRKSASRDFVAPFRFRRRKAWGFKSLLVHYRRELLGKGMMVAPPRFSVWPTLWSQPSSRADLLVSLRQFVRMYRPHEAREDTAT